MRRLPPLNALRAFETVARLGTLVRAAEELLVTPTAVGRHLKNLEDILGVPLLVRESGQLSLTVRGRDYARSLSRGFGLMLDATDTLLERSHGPPVTLRAYTTFLVRWLIPRLPEFHLANPQVELRLATAFDTVDFDRDEADLGIRYGDGRWPGLEAALLFHDEMVAFANPTLATRFDEVPLDEAFEGATLLVHSLRLDDWPDWFDAADLSDPTPARRIALGDMALIYQAALDGLGVGLSQRRYVQADLDDGRLRLVAPTVLRRDRGFHLVCRPQTGARPEVAAFRDWLIELAER